MRDWLTHAANLDAHHGPHPDRRCGFEEWLDLVFVNLSGDAEPFETFVAPLANWKLAIENNLDAAHLPWIQVSVRRFGPGLPAEPERPPGPDGNAVAPR